MQVLNRLNVGVRLGIGFALVLILMVAMIIVSLGQMSRQLSSLEEISGESRQRIGLINVMRDSVRYQAIALRDVVAQEDISFKKSELKLMREARKRYKEAGVSLAERMNDASSQGYFDQIRKLEEDVAAAVSQVMEATLSDQHIVAGDGIRDNVRPLQLKLVAALESLQQDIEARGQASVEEARASYVTTRNLLLALSGAAVLLGAFIAWLITRSIVGPLGESVSLASRIASGDLTARISVTGNDELAQLQRSLDDMAAHLAALVREVSQAAEAANAATVSLAEAAGEGVSLAADTSAQIGEVGKVMTRMTESIERVSTGVNIVATSARQTQQVSHRGNENVMQGEMAIGTVVTAMSSYAESINSLHVRIQEISAITTVIREIAEQTNLLALNAAIESARAGEMGRGFAVVADEVRKLAERTATSTGSIADKIRGISDLAGSVVDAIEGINKAVERSASVSNQTQAILGEILGAAQSVVTETGEITTAVSAQRDARQSTDIAVERIVVLAEREVTAMREIDRVVLQLKGNSERLQASIARFRT